MKIERRHVKKVTEVTSQVSVGVVVNNIVRATAPIGASPFNRIACFIGSMVLSGLLNKPIKTYTDDIIDGLADAISEKSDTKCKVVVL